MINELILAGVSFFHPHSNLDSLGIETVNGKVFVIHKVDEKETLYAIARRYGASVESIRTSNPGITSTLEVGQIIKVPYAIKATMKSASSGNTHKVAAKETMYSIAKAYGITVDDLRKWNNLADNALSVGQELYIRRPAGGTVKETPVAEIIRSTPATGTHTVATKETLYSIARQYGISIAQIRTWNSLESDELKVGQTIYVIAPDQRRAVHPVQEKVREDVSVATAHKVEQTHTKIDQNSPREQTARNDQGSTNQPKNTIRISESLKNSDEITEAGIAELIEGTEGNRKYLALHRTAPVGTILKIRNEMNNREVFVRVMGKLPDTALNDKLVIKISRSAYDRLGAIDPRFRVELTYYK
jgi:LysM repeat protein